jgi:hypothetical protein
MIMDEETVVKDALKKEYLKEIAKELAKEWGIEEDSLTVNDKGELQFFKSAISYMTLHMIPVVEKLIVKLATTKAELWLQTQLTKRT